MKNKVSVHIRKASTYSGTLCIAAALVFGSSMVNAEDDMMGTMPPPAQSSPMKDNSGDAIMDHDQMKAEHDQMAKDHKKMVKKNSMAQAGQKQKMGKMKKKRMPMNDSKTDMMEMEPMGSDKAKKPADPMPADGMDHM